MRLFGTDGIRGKYGESPLNAQEIEKISAAFTSFFNARKVLVCRDTRKSGERIIENINKGLIGTGATIHNVGILNTPAAAYLTRKLQLDGAIVASASHNPAEENGLKFFTAQGIKLTSQQEEKIEAIFFSGKAEQGKNGKIIDSKHEVDNYISFAAASAGRLDGITAVADFANGASYEVGPKVLERAGIMASLINNNPDGININAGCGSEHPELMAKKTKQEKADIGVAFDGDADRAVFSDEKGSVLNGDKTIGVLAMQMAAEGKLKKNKIVVTNYSNLGLEATLNKAGITVIRSDVGDQNVAKTMREKGLNLGGEQSGHIIFSDISTTGDGIITALQMMSVIKRTGKRLSELAEKITLYPQVMLNVQIKNRKPIEKTKLNSAIKTAEKNLDGQGRIFVRYSGTQNLVRIMVEGKSEKQINRLAQELADTAKKELGV